MDKIELEKAQDKIRLCGRNRGDHNYMPILKDCNMSQEKVIKLMCMRCFFVVSLSEIQELFPLKNF